MNEKVLSVLEYEKIKKMLEKEAGSELTRKMISQLEPFTEEYIISEEIRSTTEGVDLIMHIGSLPTGGLYDTYGIVIRAIKGGVLTCRELLKVQYNLNVASAVVDFMSGNDVPGVPAIESLTELIVPVKGLEAEIEKCIISEDEISDNASPELRDIRRKIKNQNAAIRNRLSRIITASGNQSYLQDAIVTIREGRYVIPVKQEHRNRFPGLIHDQSKGGATVFIEPQSVVELNNELKELMLEEEQEIQRILSNLSDRVGEHRYEIDNNLKLLTKLDFIMAKSKLSLKMDGRPANINKEGKLEILKGRHPLLNPDKAVPLNILIGGDFRTLIITGPNTGGKTVALKTCGLLVMMAQSGLHIPASETSTIPVFKEVYADIGDEQSIEQSLSTFSSHMKNIVKIVENAGRDSLVLLDELGAGTDPTEGAALAIAILEELYRKGAYTMATTHYNELKKYALSSDGVENGSMEFDVETLSPTYRLIIGTPGKSNAFEISRKLGMDNQIIDRASQLIEGRDIEFENVISAIEEDRKKAEKARDNAEKINQEIEKRKEDLEAEVERLQKDKEKILRNAREEARDILRDARETAKEVQKELKNLAKEDSLGKRNRNFQQTRKKLKETEDRYAEKVIKRFNKNPAKASEIKIGSKVRLLTLDQNGEVLSLPDDRDELMIQVGIMKIKAKLNDLVLIEEGKKNNKEKQRKSQYANAYRRKTANVKPELNVQGKNLDDAILEVGKYLDDVFMAGLSKVTIIHGRGEGILKQGIRDYLKHNKQVASFEPGKYNEGGEGVTIVKIKK